MMTPKAFLKLMMSVFVLFLPQLLSAQGGTNYTKLHRVTSPTHVLSLDDFARYDNLQDDVFTRIVVKNGASRADGVLFEVSIPEGYQELSSYTGSQIIDLAQKKIFFKKAGFFGIHFRHSDGRALTIAGDVNYYVEILDNGIMSLNTDWSMTNPSIPPDTHRATVRVREDGHLGKELSAPHRFVLYEWRISLSKDFSTSVAIIEESEIHRISVGEVLARAKALWGEQTSEFFLRLATSDGTSAYDTNAIPSALSFDLLKIVDERPRIYQISMPELVGGRISATHQQARAGTSVTLQVTPSAGYRLVAGSVAVVTETGVQVPLNGMSFVMPAENVQVSASFVPLEYQISIPELVGGRITATHQQASPGTSVTLRATPEPGYRLVEGSVVVVTEAGVGVPLDGMTFVMPEANVVVIANFNKLLAPDLQVERIYQRDAIISWPAVYGVSEWDIVCSNNIGTTRTEPRILLRDLEPNTEYVVTVRAKVEGSYSDPAELRFTTEAITDTTAPLPHLYDMKGTFRQGEELLLVWRDLVTPPSAIRYKLTPEGESSEADFAYLPDSLTFERPGTYRLTFQLEGSDILEVSYLITVE